jgi:PAS domain S-box-containing protein
MFDNLPKLLPDFRVRQRDYLLEIAQAITQELNLDKLLKRILQLTADLLSGHAGLVALRGEEQGWKIAVSHGINPEFIKYLDPLLADVPDNEDPASFEVAHINTILNQIARRSSWGMLSGVGLPLIVHNNVIGVIFIFRKTSGTFSLNDRKLLQSFANQAAIAVQNAQLYTQLSSEKQRMDAMLDSVADGILILSNDHKIERVNPAFSSLYGLPADQIVGRQYEDVIIFNRIDHGESLEKAEAGGWPLNAQTTLYVEGEMIRTGETSIPVGITFAPLHSLGGKLTNIIASFRDISHFRKAEDIKSTFVSVVSHELKTPVALIKGYVGTLRRNDANWDIEIVKDSLAIIEDEADRLAELIDNLLDATRLEAGEFAINASDISIPVLVNRVVKRFKTQTNKHKFNTDFPDDCPIVLVDEGRITQVLDNLISNAIKYSPQGGKIRISGEVSDDCVIISVEDEGPGIPIGDVPHIFDRFYRSEDAQKNTAGAGLGLYLARAIIEAHGGAIWVDPRTDNGARVFFSIPRSDID